MEEHAIETARVIYAMEKVYRKEFDDLARFVVASLPFVLVITLERNEDLSPIGG